MKKCPFCNKEFNSQGETKHIYFCSKEIYDKKEIRYLYICHNFPHISKRDILYEKYVIELYSLPMLQEEFGINSGAVLFLLEYYDIAKRTASESMIKIAQPKIKETCLEKYGDTNVLGKKSPKYHKRNNTVLEKYGVENVFQIQEIIDHINSDELYLERYGKTKKEFKGENRKNKIAKMSQEEKLNWLNISIHSEYAKDKLLNVKRKGSNKSKLEQRIEIILKELNISYIDQYVIKFETNRRKIYDFYLTDFNLILEINGDYWHANPLLYKADDILHFKQGVKYAKDIWESDKIKKEIANTNGVELIYIWEQDMIKKYDRELKEYITERINNVKIKNKDDK